MSTAIFVYAATAPVNGYSGGSLYARMGGKMWIRQVSNSIRNFLHLFKIQVIASIMNFPHFLDGRFCIPPTSDGVLNRIFHKFHCYLLSCIKSNSIHNYGMYHTILTFEMKVSLSR